MFCQGSTVISRRLSSCMVFWAASASSQKPGFILSSRRAAMRAVFPATSKMPPQLFHLFGKSCNFLGQIVDHRALGLGPPVRGVNVGRQDKPTPRTLLLLKPALVDLRLLADLLAEGADELGVLVVQP